MARIINEKEYTTRRNEIFDVAQRLIYTKGYEQMSIQDILIEMQMSKGAFYHYFDSKNALLEALSERMIDESMDVIIPILQHPQMKAIDKLRCYFETAARWKTDQKTFLLALLRVWYTDENAIVRQKVTRMGTTRVLPLFTEIIRQGIEEGVFTTPYSEQISEVIMCLLLGMGDSFSVQILNAEVDSDPSHRDEALSQLENIVAVYTDSLERTLGAPTGSIKIMDMDTLKDWFISPVDEMPLFRSDLNEYSKKESRI